MLRDITIGQYYSAPSLIHRLDPRTKIIGTFFFIIGLFLVNNLYGYALAAVFLGGVVLLSKIPLSFILRGLKPIGILLLITVLLNMFMVQGGAVLLEIWIIRLSEQGLYTALFMALRLIFLVVGCSMMTLSTTPLELTDGLEKLMRPLKAIKVPVHDIAMMMSIALRFIPILLEETDKIMKAQAARGADFESGTLMQRAKSLIPVLVPLFLSAFRRADELATAMEARCYRGDEGRTRMKELKYEKIDHVSKLVMLLLLAALYGTRFL